MILVKAPSLSGAQTAGQYTCAQILRPSGEQLLLLSLFTILQHSLLIPLYGTNATPEHERCAPNTSKCSCSSNKRSGSPNKHSGTYWFLRFPCPARNKTSTQTAFKARPDKHTNIRKVLEASPDKNSNTKQMPQTLESETTARPRRESAKCVWAWGVKGGVGDGSHKQASQEWVDQVCVEDNVTFYQ